MKLNAIFIGGHKEIIFFIDQWLSRKHLVSFIISDDKNVIEWANNHEIDNYPYDILNIQDKKYTTLINNTKPEFIFSIINHKPIPLIILNLAKIPINYHAGPLPKYKGVYGTSWAIYNGEKEYNITWHIMNEKIDAGIPLYTHNNVINISNRQLSAYQLEIECLQLAKESFSNLINKLETSFSTCVFKEMIIQTLVTNQKTVDKIEKAFSGGKECNFHDAELISDIYPNEIPHKLYRYIDKIDENGLILFEDSIDIIQKKYLALKLDDKQPNYLGCFKIFYNGRLLYPNVISFDLIYEKPELDLTTKECHIEFYKNCYKVTFAQLRDESGYPLNRSDLDLLNQQNTASLNKSKEFKTRLKYGLLYNQKLSEFFTGQNINYSQLLNSTIYNKNLEEFWVEELSKIEPTSLTFNIANHFKAKLKLQENNEKRKSVIWNIKRNERINQFFMHDIYLAAILAYLNYINQTEKNITFGYTDDNILDNVDELNPFFSDVLPLTFEKAIFDRKFADLLKNINTKINFLKTKKTFSRDLKLRYPSLRQNDIHFPILIYFGSKYNVFGKTYNNHWIVIIINAEKIEISYDPYFLDIRQRNDFENFIQNTLHSEIPKIIKHNKLKRANHTSFIDDNSQHNILPYLNVFLNTNLGIQPEFISVIKLFEQQYKTNPNNIALIAENKEYTYETLFQEVIQFSQVLINLKRSYTDYRSNRPLLIYLPANHNWVTAILSCLKCGIPFISINYEKNNLKEKNILHLLKDSEATEIVTVPEHMALFQNFEKNKLNIIDITSKLSSSENVLFFPSVTENTIAYIVYTSGSTKQPKGVRVSRSNLSFSTQTRISYYKSDQSLCLLPLTGRSFDAMFGMVLWALCCGGKLILLSDLDRLDTDKQLDMLSVIDKTYLIATPQQYSLILKKLDKNNIISKIQKMIKAIILGGDVWPDHLLKTHIVLLYNTELYNEYGPSECTVWTAVAKVYSPHVVTNANAHVPIGNSIDGSVKLHILDNQNRLLPPGISGELVVTGPNVTLGYKDNANSGFAVYQYHDNEIHYYRTGDIVSRFRDDQLCFMGRKGTEFKIKGGRVDVTQIINLIKNLKDVKDAYVLRKDSQLLRICIISDSFLDDERSILKKEIEYLLYFKQYLPHYLIPQDILVLNEFPLNNNGKIDEEKILELITKKCNIDKRHHSNEFLLRIINIWKRVLKNHQTINLDYNTQLDSLGIDSMNYYIGIKYLQESERIDYEDARFIFSLNNLFLQSVMLEYTINQKGINMSNHGCILLTGTTGHIGTHFLQQMYLRKSSFVKIYCLCNDNGSSHENILLNSKAKINKNLIELGYDQINFDTEENINKFIFIVGSIEEKKLKLSNEDYTKCIDEVECVFHFAAKVNHILSYDVLKKTNTDSMNHILEFAESCKNKDKMRIHFSSTIQTITIKPNYSEDDRFGYVKSKIEAEKILEKYVSSSNKSPIIVIYKMGWAGWDKNNKILKPEEDHFHCLLETCMQMQAVPDLDINLYMLPANSLVSKIIEQDMDLTMRGNEYKCRLILPRITQQINWKVINDILMEKITNSIEYKLKPHNEDIILSRERWLAKFNAELVNKKYPLKKFKELYQENIGILDNTSYNDSADTSKYRIQKSEFECMTGLRVFCKDNDIMKISNILAHKNYEIIYRLLENTNKEGVMFTSLQNWLSSIFMEHPQKFSSIHLIIRNNALDEEQKLEIIEILANKYKQIINQKSVFETTPLYEAAIYRLYTVFQFLIKNDPNLKNTLMVKSDDKFSIFMVACWFGDYRLASTFLSELQKHYPDKKFIVTNIFASLNKTNEACIHRAITAGSVAIIELMFEEKFTNDNDWNKMLVKDNVPYERPILHHAAIIGNISMIHCLIGKVLKDSLLYLLMQSNKHGHNFISFIHADKWELKIDIVKRYRRDLYGAMNYSIDNKTLEYLKVYENSYIYCEKQKYDLDTSHNKALLSLQNFMGFDLNKTMEWIGSIEADNDGYIPFHYIIMCGFDKLVDHFIKYCNQNNKILMLQIVLNYQNSKQAHRTALHFAARENYVLYNLNRNKINLISFPNIRIIKSLVDTNLVNINQRDDNKVTPCYEVIFSGIYIDCCYTQERSFDLKLDTELLIFMLKSRANIFIETNNKHSMISLACWRNAYSFVELLIQLARDLVEKRKEIAQSDRYDWLPPNKYTLLYDLNHQNSNYETPLHCAVDNRNPELIQLLLDNEANPNGEVDQYGKTPLHRAVERIENEEQLVILRQLIKAKANPVQTKSHHRKAEDLLHTKAMDLKDAVRNILDPNGNDVVKFSLKYKRENRFADLSKSIISSMMNGTILPFVKINSADNIVKMGIFSPRSKNAQMPIYDEQKIKALLNGIIPKQIDYLLHDKTEHDIFAVLAQMIKQFNNGEHYNADSLRKMCLDLTSSSVLLIEESLFGKLGHYCQKICAKFNIKIHIIDVLYDNKLDRYLIEGNNISTNFTFELDFEDAKIFHIIHSNGKYVTLTSNKVFDLSTQSASKELPVKLVN